MGARGPGACSFRSSVFTDVLGHDSVLSPARRPPREPRSYPCPGGPRRPRRAFDSRRGSMPIHQNHHRDSRRDSHHEQPATNTRVDLNLRVPRDAAGDLPAGVREVLANVDGVGAVERVEVAGVRPTAFDLRVDATAALHVDAGDPDAARARLEDGFGIEQVEALVLDYG